MKRIKLLLVIWAAMLLTSGTLVLAAAEVPAVDHAEATAVEHGGGHSGTGELVPVSPDAQKQALVQAVWVVIIFLVLLVILYPTAWKGVLHGLKTREQRIRKEIADAEAARLRAEQTLADYNQQLAKAEDRVREMLAKAHADGERLAATIREKASSEAEGIKNKAVADIDDARKTAVTQVHAEAAELATAVAEKIIRRNLNADDQRELVRASLEELESGHRN